MRAKLTVATSESETLHPGVAKFKKELLMAQTNVSLPTTMREETREQLDANVGELEEVQSRLKMKECEFITGHNGHKKKAAEAEQLLRQTASRTFDSVGLGLDAENDERPAKCAKVSHGFESNMRLPSIVPYSALLAERDEFESLCEALMLENQESRDRPR